MGRGIVTWGRTSVFKKENKTVGFYLPEKIFNEFELKTKKSGHSKSEILRRLVENWLGE